MSSHASGDAGFASDAYLAIKAHWKGLPIRRRGDRNAKRAGGAAFSDGRDPHTLGQILEITARDLGWRPEMEQAQLISDWPHLVGESTAEHTRVVELRDSTLVIQCDSTTWATELRRLRAEILTRIIDEYPNAGVRELKFLAPGAPTWRHGPRVVPGRGPRDTYG